MYSDFFSAFIAEGKDAKGNPHNPFDLYSWRPCSCDEFPSSRVPICFCQNKEVSPLLQIRWKRLVIDEGHISVGIPADLIHLAGLLSLERVWILTGTPTRNLLGQGIGLGTDSEDTIETKPDLYNMGREIIFRKIMPWYTHQRNYRTEDEMMVNPSVWGEFDFRDLKKLDNLITFGVQVPQFHANPEGFLDYVINPLFDDTGPRPGSIQVLIQVMEMNMIRHR